MEKLKLEIAALSQNVTQAQSYAVVMREIDGMRRLPIIIGIPEAQAIAVALEGVSTTRPLTHDLFKNFCTEFDIKVTEIVINDLIEGVFHSKLICEQNGNVLSIDSRTSDALALSVRFDCPIYTYEFILDRAGIIFETDQEETGSATVPNKPAKSNKPSKATNYKAHNLTKLNALLEDAIKAEDYEAAARLRDEIESREK